jgi:hypothetical protein
MSLQSPSRFNGRSDPCHFDLPELKQGVVGNQGGRQADRDEGQWNRQMAGNAGGKAHKIDGRKRLPSIPKLSDLGGCTAPAAKVRAGDGGVSY